MKVYTVGNSCWTSRIDSWTSLTCPFNMSMPHSAYPLHEAAKQCDTPALLRILKGGLADVNGKDENQCTALYYVISRDWSSVGVETVRILCEHGADVNETLPIMCQEKPTYLFTAMCEYSQGRYLLSIMRALLDAGKICLTTESHVLQFFVLNNMMREVLLYHGMRRKHLF